MAMNIQVDSSGKRRIIRIEGKVTFENCPLLQSRLDEIMDEGVNEIVIDFRAVPFIDSSGIGEILRLFRHMREVGGEVVLMNPNQKLSDLFVMYRFGQFMKICEETDLDTHDTQFPN
jgi:anti-anti-sigma factor